MELIERPKRKSFQDKNKKLKYREKATEYLTRCENLEVVIKKEQEAGRWLHHFAFLPFQTTFLGGFPTYNHLRNPSIWILHTSIGSF